MYVRIGVRGSNRGIVNWTRMTRFQDRDKANVCTFASELINSQPLSALMCLHLRIANQELESPAVCNYPSEKFQTSFKRAYIIYNIAKNHGRNTRSKAFLFLYYRSSDWKLKLVAPQVFKEIEMTIQAKPEEASKVPTYISFSNLLILHQCMIKIQNQRRWTRFTCSSSSKEERQ